jgi:hypothetical protein
MNLQTGDIIDITSEVIMPTSGNWAMRSWHEAQIIDRRDNQTVAIAVTPHLARQIVAEHNRLQRLEKLWAMIDADTREHHEDLLDQTDPGYGKPRSIREIIESNPAIKRSFEENLAYKRPADNEPHKVVKEEP